MSVTPSPIGGFAAQFFDNNGVILSGGKIYTYAAGTTTPQATYTSASGVTPHANPIILDSAGRVPGGEIWLTDGLVYKFVIETATSILLGTYDNITGVNSNFVNYTVQEEVITATAGQTVFNLSTINYTPGTNSLTVYIDGVNQYVGDSYLETDSDTVTFTAGLHVGAEVKFTTAIQTTTGAVNASIVAYDPPFTGGVSTNVQDKLAQYVSVKDFGAVGDGVTDDTAAMQAAIDSGKPILFPAGSYVVTSTISYTGEVNLKGENATIISSDLTFHFTDASNSVVEGLRLVPSVTPYTIERNTATWTAVPGDVVQSFDGYMPTSQDTDIWSGLSAPIQAQTTTLNWTFPTIWFDSSSASGASGVHVTGITGNCVTIAFDGYSNSIVENCNFTAGASIGGIVFNNGTTKNYQFAVQGFTYPRGNQNKVVSNAVSGTSFSGIWFSGNDFFTCAGNSSYANGESGIKTNQYDGTQPLAVSCTNGVISANTVKGNYYDGIDAQTIYAISGDYYGGVTVSNNVTVNSRLSGMTMNGMSNVAEGNIVTDNGGSGIIVAGKYSVVTGNNARTNCLQSAALAYQVFDILIGADGCNSVGNYVYNTVAPDTYNYVHTGALGADPTIGDEGVDSANVCSDGSSVMFVSPNIPSDANRVFSKNGVIAQNGKYASKATVTLSTLNTFVSVISGTTGMITLRDNTSGGVAVLLFDPLVAVVAVSNNITGLAYQMNAGALEIKVTSGAVPRTIGWNATLTQ